MTSYPLNFINEVRAQLNLPATQELPAGKMQSQWECPVALAISTGSLYPVQVCYDRLWVYDNQKAIFWCDVPKDVGRFIAEFDTALHPDVVAL